MYRQSGKKDSYVGLVEAGYLVQYTQGTRKTILLVYLFKRPVFTLYFLKACLKRRNIDDDDDNDDAMMKKIIASQRPVILVKVTTAR